VFDNVKNYLIAALVAAVALAGLGLWYFQKESKKDAATIAVEKVRGDTAEDAQQKGEQSSEATNKSSEKLAGDQDKVDADATKQKDTTEQKRREAESQYTPPKQTAPIDGTGMTLSNKNPDQPLIDQKSQIAMDQLWGQYCQNYPTNDTCVKLKGQQK
jgi:hypothetical protein